jgi:hypothetical protein
MALFITFAQTAAAAEAAAAAATAATAATTAAAAAPTIGAGIGALGSMAGPAAATELTAAATQTPQLVTAMQAGAIPPDVAGAGQGILQGIGTPVAESTTMGTGLQNAGQAMGQGLAGAQPLPPAGLPTGPMSMDNAAQVMNQGIAGAQPLPPAGLPGNMTAGTSQIPTGAAESVAGLPGYTAPVENIAAAPPAAESTSGGIMNSLERGFNLARDFASNAYEGYKKAPTSLQYLGAGYAAKKLGLFGQNEQPGKPSYKKQDMSQFRAWSPNPYPTPGRAGFADGGPVEAMSNMNMYPMSQQPRVAYANPGIQNPIPQDVFSTGAADRLDPYTGMPTFAEGGVPKQPNYKAMLEGKTPDEVAQDAAQAKATAERFGVGIVPRSRSQNLMSPASAAQAELSAMMKKYGIKSALPKIKDPQEGMSDVEAASGGIMYGLGGYSDGGRLLKGPGDGVSDSIPASIGGRQPARLADGEFVVPARIVSELGNGSTDAGARKLYAMMDRVQGGRKRSVGKGKVAVDSKADKHLPA